MPDQSRGVVLRNRCALTLSDEPLARAVENGAMQLWVHGPEVGIALHHLVHRHRREQPALAWQGGDRS